jgi:hypothetical protein
MLTILAVPLEIAHFDEKEAVVCNPLKKLFRVSV